MGGAPCRGVRTTPGALGTSTGVGAGPTFVLSGPVTPPHTRPAPVWWSPTRQPTWPTPSADATSAYRLVRRDADNAVLRDDGVPFSPRQSNHGTREAGTTRPVLGRVPLDTSTQNMQLWKGEPPGGVLLYTAGAHGRPVVAGSPWAFRAWGPNFESESTAGDCRTRTA